MWKWKFWNSAPVQKLWEETGGYFGFISAVFGGFSAFKLTLDLINFRISFVMEKLIAFYETYPLQLVMYPFHLLGIQLSPFVANILIFYLIFAGFLYRASPALRVQSKLEAIAKFFSGPVLFVLIVLAFPFIILWDGLLYLYRRLFNRLGKHDLFMQGSAQQAIFSSTIEAFVFLLLAFGSMILACSLFFVVNYAFL